MCDPYDTGTPKYSTATDIYDALCNMVTTEEMGILSEMFPDVSYENQEYYYTDKGHDLKERFEALSDYGDKMWLMDLAVTQMGLEENRTEVHDTIFEALNNIDLAKRLGFKKLFIDSVLYGDKSQYGELTEAFELELRELSRFDYWSVLTALYNADKETRGQFFRPPNTEYNRLCDSVYNKIFNMQLHKETQLIAECRAHLTSYDDFMLGLRMNQELYNRQEQLYNEKVYALNTSYEQQVKRLLATAEAQGVTLSLGNDVKLLNDGSDTSENNQSNGG